MTYDRAAAVAAATQAQVINISITQTLQPTLHDRKVQRYYRHGASKPRGNDGILRHRKCWGNKTPRRLLLETERLLEDLRLVFCANK